MKIDIIHATAGEGHRKIALAIEAAFKEQNRDDLEIRQLNALDYVDSTFQKTYAPIYYWAVRHAAAVWGASYEILDWQWLYNLLRPIRSLTNSHHAKKLLAAIARHQPDIVISTHFLPPEILGRAKLKGLIKSKLWTVITDFYPHTFWVNPGTDIYWVMTHETKDELIHRHVPSEKIAAGGIPILKDFFPTEKKAEFREKYGFSKDRFTVLLTSGSFGLGPQEAILENLKSFADKIQCFVVCANNKELKSILDAKTYPFPVKTFGFVDFMPELMEASDLMIAKSGGSTTSEALAKGVPMVIMSPIPGQETRNANLLKKRNASYFLKRPEEIKTILQSIFDNPQEFARKKIAVETLAQPNAAFDLVQKVLSE